MAPTKSRRRKRDYDKLLTNIWSNLFPTISSPFVVGTFFDKTICEQFVVQPTKT